MKVRMLTSVAGHAEPRYGLEDSFSFACGQEVDLHKDLAKAWIGSGMAEPARKRSSVAMAEEESAQGEESIDEAGPASE